MQCPSDRNVNWMPPPCPGKVNLVQVKEPYGNLDMVTCRLLFCSPSICKIMVNMNPELSFNFSETEEHKMGKLLINYK